MQSLQEILTETHPDLAALMKPDAPFDLAAYMRRNCERWNRTEGRLGGLDCPECKNRGYFMVVVDGPNGPSEGMQECRCMAVRRSLERIERSGMATALKTCRFDTYQAREGWQIEAMETAKRYSKDSGEWWLFMGGAIGSGKTHLCTAVCRQLILRMPVLYAIWPEELQTLKATRFDEGEYTARMRRLMDVELLYLDDFLKVCRGQAPTATDVQIAHELINHRYATHRKTIISSERTLDEIVEIDQATGGRIMERCGEYVVDIGRDERRDWRQRA